MLGAIIGDICGSTYEWENEKDYNKIELYREGSMPTDDSVMTVAVAKALMDSYGSSDDAVRSALVLSMQYYGHLLPYSGYGGRFNKWLENYETDPYNSFGNGSGMRVASAGWIFDNLDDVLHYAKLSAEVTHNHPEGIKGAQSIAACIFLARNGRDKEHIRNYISENFYDMNFKLDDIRDEYEFDVTCQGSCPQAIEAFLESKDFYDAIKLAISVGGDSDTIAAMTGAIAEAYYGLPKDAIPEIADLCDTYKMGGELYNYGALVDVIVNYHDFMKDRGCEILPPANTSNA